VNENSLKTLSAGKHTVELREKQAVIDESAAMSYSRRSGKSIFRGGRAVPHGAQTGKVQGAGRGVAVR
jgi:hypothetical protein